MSSKLNDYDLTTAAKYHFNGNDTILIVIYFPGLSDGDRRDTLISVKKLDLFNGDRRSYSTWKKSGGIKKISLAINQTVIDTAIFFQNTYKIQEADFSFKPLYSMRGYKDTIRIVVKEIYPGIDNEYNISELKLGARRYY